MHYGPTELVAVTQLPGIQYTWAHVMPLVVALHSVLQAVCAQALDEVRGAADGCWHGC